MRRGESRKEQASASEPMAAQVEETAVAAKPKRAKTTKAKKEEKE